MVSAGALISVPILRIVSPVLAASCLAVTAVDSFRRVIGHLLLRFQILTDARLGVSVALGSESQPAGQLSHPALLKDFDSNDRLKPRVPMAYPGSSYIEERDGGLYVTGSRVSLDSVAIRFQEGASAEKIVESFPTLKLWQVYGAIAYYLENEEMIKQYIDEGQRELERTVPPLSQQDPELFARLQGARQKMKCSTT